MRRSVQREQKPQGIFIRVWSGQIGGQSVTWADDRWKGLERMICISAAVIGSYYLSGGISCLITPCSADWRNGWMILFCYRGIPGWMDSTVIRIWTTGVINEGRQKNTKGKEGCTAIMNKSTYKDVYGFRNVLPRYSVRFSRDCGMRTRRWMFKRGRKKGMSWPCRRGRRGHWTQRDCADTGYVFF